ncbi:MAG: OmpA family protein [Gammaproteobacteria bacterium]|nr:OmpA family protein [Gammaproteobacteria bacterium]
MRHVVLAALLLLLAVPRPVQADAREAEIFAAAETARAAAQAVEAALLAPGSYGQGSAALERAQRDYRGGGEEAAAATLADTARRHFEAAAAAARQAQLTLATALARREDARRAEAFRLAVRDWVRAEEQLRSAAQRLEKTDVEGALARAAEATQGYDRAELLAIKAMLLTEARSGVVGLDTAGSARLAPRTTARARELLRQAEATLDADRRATAAAGELAAAATAEARHALALAQYLAAARERDATSEDLMLAWEASLAAVAEAAGTGLERDGGPQAAGEDLAARTGELRAQAEGQAADLAQRRRQITALEDEIRDLDAQLAGANRESRSLGERLAAREQVNEQFARLEQLLPPDQATVLRQGGDIIVRVQGVAFASGSAKLPASARTLLDELARAAQIYPGARLAVEGHTDASGDSAANQRLSQARAEAVRDYLVGERQVPAGHVTALGYGDSRPIASNATEAGRRANRRIDLVITPRAGAAP